MGLCWMNSKKTNRKTSQEFQCEYTLIVAEHKVWVRKQTRNWDEKPQRYAGSVENDERTSVFHSLIDHNFCNHSIHLSILDFHITELLHSFICYTAIQYAHLVRPCRYFIGILNKGLNVLYNVYVYFGHVCGSLFFYFCLTPLNLLTNVLISKVFCVPLRFGPCSTWTVPFISSILGKNVYIWMDTKVFFLLGQRPKHWHIHNHYGLWTVFIRTPSTNVKGRANRNIKKKRIPKLLKYL